ncbi:SPRY domain-containing protein [Phenylobacterium koreense]|uniref:B30.2/SPRY domain-containing protein n=1 Tax=Phenylobacterium koreense TaxID=266125 RepID=A0ABV2EGK6_9CAUL
MTGILAALLAEGAGGVNTLLSTTDKHADLTVASSGLQATRTAASNMWRTGRATVGRNEGKWYFEANCTTNATGGYLFMGLANAAATVTNYLNLDDNSVGYLSSGQVRIGYNVTGATAQAWTTPAAVARLAVDLDENRFWCSVGAGNWNGRSFADPSTNVGGEVLPATMVSGEGLIYPAYSIYQNGLTLNFNFGASAFAGAVPAGFSAWNGG